MNQKLVLKWDKYNTCTINLHGATITSWRIQNQEQLLVSKRAVFNGIEPIRGGIPIIFPTFGPWPNGPQNGFARIVCWNIEKAPERQRNGDVEAVLYLTDTAFTRSLWMHPFKLTLKIIFGEFELQSNITLYNRSKDTAFSFNFLLHNYFKVPNVERCEILGLHNCKFVDKTNADSIDAESREIVTIDKWTKRIYKNSSNEHVIRNVMLNREIRVKKYNLPETYIWNPWLEESEDLPNFKADEYNKMMCVGSGQVSDLITLLPEATFEANQILQVIMPD